MKKTAKAPRQSPHASPMGRAKPDDTFVDGYMDATDWECELGCAVTGNKVYPSVAALKAGHKGCIDECGIVKVRVQFLRVVKKPMDIAERAKRANQTTWTCVLTPKRKGSRT